MSENKHTPEPWRTAERSGFPFHIDDARGESVRIRSGLCPNGHGLMTMGGWGQECPTCGFTCNTMPDTPNGADA